MNKDSAPSVVLTLVLAALAAGALRPAPARAADYDVGGGEPDAAAEAPREPLTLSFQDAATGQAIAGARVEFAGIIAVTNRGGEALFPSQSVPQGPQAASFAVFSKPGYATAKVPLRFAMGKLSETSFRMARRAAAEPAAAGRAPQAQAPASPPAGPRGADPVQASHQTVIDFLHEVLKGDLAKALELTGGAFRKSVQVAELAKFRDFVASRGQGGQYVPQDGGAVGNGQYVAMGLLRFDDGGRMIITCKLASGKIISLQERY